VLKKIISQDRSREWASNTAHKGNWRRERKQLHEIDYG